MNHNNAHSKQLEPEKVRGMPLSMDSYKWLYVRLPYHLLVVADECSYSFHACRYPLKPSDTARKFNLAKHNHVVFIRKNKFFKVALVDKEGRELSAAELEAQIDMVIKLAGDEKGLPVGALTSENRDVWTDVREALFYSTTSKLTDTWHIGSCCSTGRVSFERYVSGND